MISTQKWNESAVYTLITLENSKGMKAVVGNLGCVLQQLWVKNKQGVMQDVVLGFDKPEDYLQSPYLGTIIGPVANRLTPQNVHVGSHVYDLEVNEVANNTHLHGGKGGFCHHVWEFDTKSCASYDEVIFHAKFTNIPYLGPIEVEHRIRLCADNKLSFYYKAHSSEPALINLTNHSAYNLAGHDGKSVWEQYLKIPADRITSLNERSLPTGEFLAVKGTGYDFLSQHKMSENQQALPEGKLDVNYVLQAQRSKCNDLVLAAEMYDKTSGRFMRVLTTEPGVQAYNTHFLGPKPVGKSNTIYKAYAGLCLETQAWPDAPSHKHFPRIEFMAEEVYEQLTVHEFSLI